jgi:hypothetical protein
MSAVRVLEKFYSAKELSWLVGFNERYWRDRMKAEPKLTGADGVLISQCVVISGEFFAPASWANALLARSPLQYDAGIKARNKSDLERKLRKAAPPVAVAA